MYLNDCGVFHIVYTLRVSRSKTECIEYEFGRREYDVYGTKWALTMSVDVIDEVVYFISTI